MIVTLMVHRFLPFENRNLVPCLLFLNRTNLLGGTEFSQSLERSWSIVNYALEIGTSSSYLTFL